jgi:hypothetical protein
LCSFYRKIIAWPSAWAKVISHGKIFSAYENRLGCPGRRSVDLVGYYPGFQQHDKANRERCH